MMLYLNHVYSTTKMIKRDDLVGRQLRRSSTRRRREFRLHKHLLHAFLPLVEFIVDFVEILDVHTMTVSGLANHHAFEE